MLFYEIQITANEHVLADICSKTENIDTNEYKKEVLFTLNSYAQSYCRENGDAIIIFTDFTPDFVITAAAGFNYKIMENSCAEDQTAAILKHICDKKIDISANEITIASFENKFSYAEDMNYFRHPRRSFYNRLRIQYFDNHTYTVKQALIPDRRLSFEQAEERARQMMASNEFLDELGRIYALEHPKKFFGHPVHYKICADDIQAAYAQADLLVSCLYSNGRLRSRRMDKISKITESCYDESDMEDLFYHAQGGTVVIELCPQDDGSSNYATSYEQVICFLEKLIRTYCSDVLCIFIELTKKQGFSKKLLSRFSDDIDIITIPEGAGNRETARHYLTDLIEHSPFSEYKGADIPLDKEQYKASEIHKIFRKWTNDSLKRNIYTAYQCNLKTEKSEEKPTGSAYETLSKMVGLQNVKAVINQVIASYKMQKLKNGYLSDQSQTCKHMIFTGNPGSAKTTVARLIAQIFKDNEILETGAFVECGRADLVGRYVGWTAKEVKAKFKQAEGGILFIDEAYSLVEEDGLYGDEAINTIVQEMENRRDRVIVIFAGYPDKMQAFLDKNEGLRSRIAFHINFPDYTKDELMQILEQMLGNMQYTASEGAKQKASEIFEQAVKLPHFGNGRLVRNMLEQATMKQAARLYQTGFSDADNQKMLFSLDETDFELPSLLPETERKTRIGFCAEND